MITVFRMHEISCEKLRWFVLVSTAKLNPKIMPRKNFFLHPQEEFASCSWLRVIWALVLETCLLSKTFQRPGRSVFRHASASLSCEMFIGLKSLPKTFSKKLYLRLYLTQIVHSNSKMLFLWPNNSLSKFLWCAAFVYLFFTSRKSSVFRMRR